MDILLSDLFIHVIPYLDYYTLKKLCITSIYIKNLCNTNYNRKLLIDKFSKDSLNTSAFTQDELRFYDKIKPLKNRRMFLKKNKQFISDNNNLYILYNNYLITLPQYKSINNKYLKDPENLKRKQPTNKELRYLTGSDNNGNCTNENFMDMFYPLDKFIINILIDFRTGINITTKEGEIYKFEYLNHFQMNKINTPFTLIQSIGNLYLSDDGDVYQKDKFNDNNLYYKIQELDKIKELITEHILLSIDGNVYTRYIDGGSTNFELNKNLKNIKQIYPSEYDYASYYLDIKGDIHKYLHYNLKYIIITNQNIIEIISIGNFIYALSDDMKLYVYDKSDGVYYYNYDLLNL